ncbi:hypothetical protein Tco_0441231 [Tanacetum coccineum]
MAERPNLDEDRGGKLIDPTHFRGMVGSLMYLSASRPDIVLAVLSTSENDSSYKYLYEFDESREALHIFRDIFQNIIRAF